MIDRLDYGRLDTQRRTRHHRDVRVELAMLRTGRPRTIVQELRTCAIDNVCKGVSVT